MRGSSGSSSLGATSVSRGLAFVLRLSLAKQARSKRTEGPDTKKKPLVLIQFADLSTWRTEGVDGGEALCVTCAPQ